MSCTCDHVKGNNIGSAQQPSACVVGAAVAMKATKSWTTKSTNQHRASEHYIMKDFESMNIVWHINYPLIYSILFHDLCSLLYYGRPWKPHNWSKFFRHDFPPLMNCTKSAAASFEERTNGPEPVEYPTYRGWSMKRMWARLFQAKGFEDSRPVHTKKVPLQKKPTWTTVLA